MSKLPLRARLATAVGGAAGRVSQLTGRGDGSVIGGVLGLRVEPELLRLLAAGRQIVLVTGATGNTPPPRRSARGARRWPATRSGPTWRPVTWPPSAGRPTRPTRSWRPTSATCPPP